MNLIVLCISCHWFNLLGIISNRIKKRQLDSSYRQKQPVNIWKVVSKINKPSSRSQEEMFGKVRVSFLRPSVVITTCLWVNDFEEALLREDMLFLIKINFNQTFFKLVVLLQQLFEFRVEDTKGDSIMNQSSRKRIIQTNWRILKSKATVLSFPNNNILPTLKLEKRTFLGISKVDSLRESLHTMRTDR
jgi:hypothetical protein